MHLTKWSYGAEKNGGCKQQQKMLKLHVKYFKYINSLLVYSTFYCEA